MSQANFQFYDPLKHGSCLMLDGQTLSNLEILNNNIDDSDKGTLFKLLCHCTTGFGKRLFRKWLCHPLRNVEDIDARLSAGDDLLDGELRGAVFESSSHGAYCGCADRIQSALKSMPDLERLISRVHGSLISRFTRHP